MHAMAASGWEFVEAYVLVNSDRSATRWILRLKK
jgi:hypothetical protein